MADLSGKNVQLCGRVSDLPRDRAEEEFGRAASWVKAAGAENVFNPVAVISVATSHEAAMRMCLGWMVNYADAVVVLPGWIASSGAKIEYEVAHACGIEVVALADLVDIEAL